MKTAAKAVLIASAVFGCMLLADGALGMKAYASSEAKKQATLYINQAPVTFNDIIPIIDEDKTMYVPIRAFAEKMNYSFEWKALGDDQTQIEIANGEKTIVITFESDKPFATVNGVKVDMGNEPWSYNDHTYIPFRFLMEQFDLDFKWNPEYLNTVPRIQRFAEEDPNPTKPPVTKNKAERVLDTAYDQLGVKYVWGGTTPSGFDCSGFVKYAFSKHGINLPRTSRDMYKYAGTPVKNPEQGDLVFFAAGGKGSSITHVGIYVGNNKYINASSGKARKVVVSSLSSSWSKRTYVGAKSVM
ncbi:C40 family peptidase [Paenibacillus sp. 481]|uniref:C40 family peptidase n=1 Tax=Paenibacillus sp. 481 TaxID=2835869 RepID=UPI001E47576E|nr:NlpC/P60 family protein [Paenibacillus sp. 481]UHA75594.1 C40 family peptidase [Paenibacillus sp. 481]